jgi:predicted PurR-regulated permease PerM
VLLAPAEYRDDARRIYAEIKEIWRGYLRGNLTLMTVTGILFTIAWLLIGVPGAIVLGLIAGLLTIIPDLGPAIAAILAVLVSLVEGSTYLPVSEPVFSLIVMGVYLVLINIKNIWIRPRIFGRSVHMHDGIVFVAIVAAIVVEGVLGALVVIPVLASAAVIGGYVWRRVLGEDPFPLKNPILAEPAEQESITAEA